MKELEYINPNTSNETVKIYYFSLFILAVSFLFNVFYLGVYTWIYEGFLISIVTIFFVWLYSLIVAGIGMFSGRGILASILVFVGVYWMNKFSFYTVSEMKLVDIKAEYYSDNEEARKIFHNICKENNLAYLPPDMSYNLFVSRYKQTAKEYVRDCENSLKEANYKYPTSKIYENGEDFNNFDYNIIKVNNWFRENGSDGNNPYFLNLVPPAKHKDWVGE